MPRLALDGVRVIDLTYVWAGPYCTRLLGDFGAEVIKIEALVRPDARGFLEPQPPGVGLFPYGVAIHPGARMGEKPYNRHSGFHDHSRNKLGLSLDLTDARAKEVFKRLIKVADVVVENYTPRVMKQFGLDYPVLRELNPQLVMISMSGYGAFGPYSEYVAFGPNIEPGAGHSSMMGYPGGPPLKSGEVYGDPTSGIYAVNAILFALRHRRRTGQGQHIDLAQFEANTSLIGDAILDWTMNERLWPRRGNQDTSKAPHGCYRCRGEDEWVAIAIRSDEDWQRFSQAVGEPAWTKEERFAGVLGRWQHEEELRPLIEEWTKGRDRFEIARRLQEVGVPAAAVHSAKDLVESPHLRARDWFTEMVIPEEEKPWPFPGFTFCLEKTPGAIRRPAPSFGEHNHRVLHDLLGLAESEIAELEADRIIGTDPSVLL